MSEIRMPLREASELLGIPANTLRSRYKVGKLKGDRDNSGRLFVWIDPTSAGSKKPTSHNAKHLRNEGELEALKGHVETLKVQLDRAEARATEWQGKAEALQDELAQRNRPWLRRVFG